MCKDDFLAGYQAAKNQLAVADKVIIPQENCEAALKVMQSAQDLSEQTIKWMKTLPTASERCNQCACEGYGAGYLAAAPHWISVKERLPDSWDEYLVNIRNHRCELATFTDFINSWCLTGSDAAGLEDDITHWMPLPKPPTEEA
jgi:hypothetical protein